MTVAADLFWERGYAATSMTDIFVEAESSAGNLYNFFASKEALLSDAIGELEQRILRDAFGPSVDAPRDSVDRVVKIIDVFRDNLLRSDYQRGSPLGRLAAELAGSEVGSRRLATAFRSFMRKVSECILQLDPSMTPDRADELASLIVSLLEGSVLQAQALRSVEPLDACRRHVRAMLASSVSGSAGRAGSGVQKAG